MSRMRIWKLEVKSVGIECSNSNQSLETHLFNVLLTTLNQNFMPNRDIVHDLSENL